MSTHSPIRKVSRRKPPKERRAPAGSPGSLRWLNGLLGRPVALERRDGHLHVVLVERRRARSVGQGPALEPLRGELRARLLAHDDGEKPMRELTLVHDALGRDGWASVGALAANVLAAAVAQAGTLVRAEPSPALGFVVDRLRVLRVGAELREQRAPEPRFASDVAAPDVSESTPEEFAALERAWVDTEPPDDSTPDGDA